MVLIISATIMLFYVFLCQYIHSFVFLEIAEGGCSPPSHLPKFATEHALLHATLFKINCIYGYFSLLHTSKIPYTQNNWRVKHLANRLKIIVGVTLIWRNAVAVSKDKL